MEESDIQKEINKNLEEIHKNLKKDKEKDTKISKEYALSFYNKISEFDYSQLKCSNSHYISISIDNGFEPDMMLPFLSHFLDCDIPFYLSSELNSMRSQCSFSNGWCGNNIIEDMFPKMYRYIYYKNNDDDDIEVTTLQKIYRKSKEHKKLKKLILLYEPPRKFLFHPLFKKIIEKRKELNITIITIEKEYNLYSLRYKNDLDLYISCANCNFENNKKKDYNFFFSKIYPEVTFRHFFELFKMIKVFNTRYGDQMIQKSKTPHILLNYFIYDIRGTREKNTLYKCEYSREDYKKYLHIESDYHIFENHNPKICFGSKELNEYDHNYTLYKCVMKEIKFKHTYFTYPYHDYSYKLPLFDINQLFSGIRKKDHNHIKISFLGNVTNLIIQNVLFNKIIPFLQSVQKFEHSYLYSNYYNHHSYRNNIDKNIESFIIEDMDHKVLNKWCKKKYNSHFINHKLITPIPNDLIIIDYRDILLNRKNCTDSITDDFFRSSNILHTSTIFIANKVDDYNDVLLGVDSNTCMEFQMDIMDAEDEHLRKDYTDYIFFCPSEDKELLKNYYDTLFSKIFLTFDLFLSFVTYLLNHKYIYVYSINEEFKKNNYFLKYSF
jgi:hypothetical protein